MGDTSPSLNAGAGPSRSLHVEASPHLSSRIEGTLSSLGSVNPSDARARCGRSSQSPHQTFVFIIVGEALTSFLPKVYGGPVNNIGGVFSAGRSVEWRANPRRVTSGVIGYVCMIQGCQCAASHAASRYNGPDRLAFRIHRPHRPACHVATYPPPCSLARSRQSNLEQIQKTTTSFKQQISVRRLKIYLNFVDS